MPSYSDSTGGSSRPPETGTDLEVLYEDNHLIAVYKPTGLLTQGDASGEASLLDLTRSWIKAKYLKPGGVFVGLIHRLDRPVSGVVLFAKTSKGASRLSEQFRTHDVAKIYWALVEGVPAAESAALSHYLGGEERPPFHAHEQSGPGRKLARLRYHTLASEGGHSLLEVTLETGRKHQIRSQLSAVGHPILGDTLYGAQRPSPFGEGIALVAVSLEFSHPVRGERIRVEVPVQHLDGWRRG